MNISDDKYIQIGKVVEQCGLSPTTIWREIRAGRFPRNYRTSPGRVGWLQSEIDAWKIARRVASEAKDGNDYTKALIGALRQFLIDPKPGDQSDATVL